MKKRQLLGSMKIALGRGPQHYTDCARIARELAVEESKRLFESYVFENHLVLGLIGAGGLATSVFLSHGVTLFTLRQMTREHMFGTGCKYTEPKFLGVYSIEKEAVKIAAFFGHDQVSTGHLLLSVLTHKYGTTNPLIDLLQVDSKALTALTVEALETFSTTSETAKTDYKEHYSQISFTDFSNVAAEALLYAKDESRRLQHNFVCTEHLLLGLARAEGEVREFLCTINVSLEQLRTIVKKMDGTCNGFVSLDAPLTLRARRVLCIAQNSTEQSNKVVVDSKAILDALSKVKDGLASLILEQVLGGDIDNQTLRQWLELPSNEQLRQ